MSAKIYFTEEKETLLITLYAKAIDSRSKNSILNDKTADKFVGQIDYDFTKFRDISNNAIVIRARQFDDWIKEFISTNQNAVVVYLGCGLDTRITRISPPSTVTWFDIDYPEVIELRRNFYNGSGNYHMLSSSVTEFNWLEQVPKGRPALIVAEGLLEYLEQDQVKLLLNRLTDYFIHGEIVFDVMNSFAVNSGKEKLKATTGAEHKWIVDDIGEVDGLDPKLHRMTSLPLLRSSYMRKLPFRSRLLMGILSLFDSYRNMIRLLRYRF